MSLKAKNEAAFLAVIAAGISPALGLNGYSSQEDSSITRTLPLYSVEDLGGTEQPLGTGVYRRKVLVRIRSTSDKQKDDVTGAVKAAHAANVTAVQQALVVNPITLTYDLRDLAARLSAAQTDYHCFGVINRGGPDVEPEARSFVDGLFFEVSCIEADCS